MLFYYSVLLSFWTFFNFIIFLHPMCSSFFFNFTIKLENPQKLLHVLFFKSNNKLTSLISIWQQPSRWHYEIIEIDSTNPQDHRNAIVQPIVMCWDIATMCKKRELKWKRKVINRSTNWEQREKHLSKADFNRFHGKTFNRINSSFSSSSHKIFFV